MADKRAVILIHGLGDQSPMATLRGFVDAVWTTHLGVSGGSADTWTKPDALLNSYEVRRITTGQDTAGVRTDFFEFYWAHLMPDTAVSSVVRWLLRLFARSPRRVPKELTRIWITGWVLIVLLIATLGGFAWAILGLVNPAWYSLGQTWVPLVAVPLIGFVLWFLRNLVLAKVVGDAARYLTALPENIGARTAIRESGLRLLRALHESGDYDRIIVVGHSLGAVIGYDIMGFYWGEICKDLKHPAALKPALAAIERASRRRRDDPADDEASLKTFRAAQEAYGKLIASTFRPKWVVTDFVTLGSPLTHAHYLLVDDREEPLQSELRRARLGWVGLYLGLGKPESELTAFDRVARLFAVRANQREFPMCPPQTEPVLTNPCSPDAGDDAFSYRLGGNGPDKDSCVPHHAAMFAAVRWTNIYAPLRGVLRGDPVGGPARKLFGPGVMDMPLSGGIADRRFAHTYYWQGDPKNPMGDKPGVPVPQHLDALRTALGLRDRAEPGG